MPRAREKLLLANGPHPEIAPQSDETPHIHLSHTVVSTTKLEEEFRCSGVRYRCFSFVYVVPEAIYWSPRALESYLYNVKKKNHIMMDSGAFSFQMFLVKKKKNVHDMKDMINKTLDQYVEFCKNRKHEWDFYVTFDYIQDVEVVWKITQELKNRGLKNVVPVYHGDQSLDWLKKYADAGHKRIGISTLPARKKDYRKTRLYLDGVFKVLEPYKVKTHGFAITSLNLMYAYDFTSVDSSSWSRTASYGSIYVPDYIRGSLSAVHVSMTGGLKDASQSATNLSPQALRSVRDYIENKGWDFDLLRRSLQYRFIYNGAVFAQMNNNKKMLEFSFL